MKLDIFSEMQSARIANDIDSSEVVRRMIEQAQAADRAGFDCWWAVEHHSAASFSISSAPELMLAVLAQHTRDIRLGTAGILAPFAIHHPVRIAERAAWIDVLSDGRLELGLARSGGAEWETFGVDPDRTRAELIEAIRMIPKMWAAGPFSWESDLIQVPEREIMPKPVQSPHPRLWQTVTGPESCQQAGRLGVGMLGSAVFSPLDHIRRSIGFYNEGLAEAVPAGESVNDQKGVFTLVHCAETRAEAIESGAAEAALWFMNEAPNVFKVGREGWLNMIRGVMVESAAANPILEAPEPELTAADLNDPVPAIALMNRQRAGEELDPEEVFDAVEPFDTCVIGDVDSCRRKLRAFEATGLDRLMCLMQFGTLPHESAVRSIEVIGKHLVPEFARPVQAG
jgi:alkanesulfonate monooxygenase SsuD/methylene tetrahydromethanopterin reductase-like flavin-dependent oxidoreductase (luciferase family)